MIGDYGPTMPVPRALETIGTESGDIPIRMIIAAIANAMGGQITEAIQANPGADMMVTDALESAVAVLDDLVDEYDRVFPQPSTEVGAFP